MAVSKNWFKSFHLERTNSLFPPHTRGLSLLHRQSGEGWCCPPEVVSALQTHTGSARGHSREGSQSSCCCWFRNGRVSSRKAERLLLLQNELNQRKGVKPVWPALEQLPYIVLPSDLHCCLGHEKMSLGGASSHVEYNKHKGSASVKHFLLTESENLLVAGINMLWWVERKLAYGLFWE